MEEDAVLGGERDLSERGAVVEATRRLEQQGIGYQRLVDRTLGPARGGLGRGPGSPAREGRIRIIHNALIPRGPASRQARVARPQREGLGERGGIDKGEPLAELPPARDRPVGGQRLIRGTTPRNLPAGSRSGRWAPGKYGFSASTSRACSRAGPVATLRPSGIL